jgi:probable addiction module antidote protein
MARSKDFNDLLIQSLKSSKEAKAYFDAILEECKNCDEKEAQKLLLLALKNITEAQGGIAKLAIKTGLGRESLYKTLSAKGNPKLSTLITVTYALLSKR